ncbi:MAG TPA: metal-sulfur cluster assembly factor [Ktedonobacterales bacterium]|jgi:metal-sulfur cluster biosynthetic enzyme
MLPSDSFPGDASALPDHPLDFAEGMAHPDTRGASDGRLDREVVIEALRACYDPCCRERGVSVVDLGLIQAVQVEGGQVSVTMLLTSGWYPFSAHLEQIVEAEVRRLPGVEQAHVEVVWHPVWTPARMSDEARHRLTLPMAQLLPLREALSGEREDAAPSS